MTVRVSGVAVAAVFCPARARRRKVHLRLCRRGRPPSSLRSLGGALIKDVRNLLGFLDPLLTPGRGSG